MAGEQSRGHPAPGGAAYVVLTHRDWPQVQRLARAIRSSSPEAFVLIAHDDRTTAFPTETDDPRVQVFVHGLDTDWGSWELVEATLRAFDEVRRRADPSMVVLVSGQDYPIRPLAEWEADVLAAGGWVGRAEALHYTAHWGRTRGEGQDELTRYAYRWFRTPLARLGFRVGGRAGAALRRVRGAIALRLEPVLSVRVVRRGRGVHWGIRRPTPFSAERPCHSGSQWLAICRPELDRLLDEDLAPGSRLRRFYRRTIIPDESAIVTPLAWRSPPADRAPVTDVSWDAELDQPTVRTLDDLDRLESSGSAFCRKVDPVASADLMDALDRRIPAAAAEE
ncbi:beta-1,6-N-acetylglucosaminyltransferase [Agromyces sp. GXQ0307]|uniref:beta-1,6-N-acetylglucosaminyltransferase n=1 Tax=Agromyces sp. GXQ0307 TaxID=3377835 RepID=UPI00383A595F